MSKVLILKDKANTRIVLDQITSYSSDFDLLPHKVETLVLSIGSAVRKLLYVDAEARDADFKQLDTIFNVGNQVR